MMALQKPADTGRRPLTQRMVRAAELINSGQPTEQALVSAGYSPKTARGDAHKVLARLRDHGLVTDPSTVQATVTARAELIEQYLDKQASLLEEAHVVIAAALRGEAITAAGLSPELLATITAVENRVIGRATAKAEADVSGELTIRFVNDWRESGAEHETPTLRLPAPD